MDIINIDTFIGGKENERQNEPILPQFEFRMLVIGGSGTGKTNMVINLIRNMAFDRLYVFALDIFEEKYEFLKRFAEDIRDEKEIKWKEKLNNLDILGEIKLKRQILRKEGYDDENLTDKQILNLDYLKNYRPIPYMCDIKFSNKLEDVPEPETLKRVYNVNNDKMEFPISLFVFDDFVTAKDQESIKDIFTMGRKHGISSIYISQSLISVPKMIRDWNIDTAAIYEASRAEMRKVFPIYGKGIKEIRDFYKVFETATRDQYDFLLIDMKSSLRNLKKRFRRNFEIGSIFDDKNNFIEEMHIEM